MCLAPLFKHGLQFGPLLSPHCCKFAGDGSVIHWPQWDWESNWAFLPNSVQVNSRSGKFHFIQAPCLPSSDALAFRWSPYMLLTSAWTIMRLSVADAFDNCWKCESPTPCRPDLVFSMISRKFSILLCLVHWCFRWPFSSFPCLKHCHLPNFLMSSPVGVWIFPPPKKLVCVIGLSYCIVQLM